MMNKVCSNRHIVTKILCIGIMMRMIKKAQLIRLLGSLYFSILEIKEVLEMVNIEADLTYIFFYGLHRSQVCLSNLGARSQGRLLSRSGCYVLLPFAVSVDHKMNMVKFYKKQGKAIWKRKFISQRKNGKSAKRWLTRLRICTKWRIL
jgi:hypothetical protein